MRNDPLYIAWRIQFESEQAMKASQEAVRVATDGATELRETVRCFPGGVEVRSLETHRIGSYFEEVRTLPSQEPLTCRLLFHRLPAAPRYWKDVMVRLLGLIRDSAANTSVTMEYRGDEEPADEAR